MLIRLGERFESNPITACAAADRNRAASATGGQRNQPTPPRPDTGRSLLQAQAGSR
jgi:hypothetical protein